MLSSSSDIIGPLSRAQTGQAREVVTELRERSGSADRAPHCSVHYALGVALHCLGEHEEAVAAGEQLIAAARAADEPDWVLVGEMFGLLQQVSNPVSVELPHAAQVLPGLVEATQSLMSRPTADTFGRLTVWTTIGRCYLGMRLFELAEPCFQHAAAYAAAEPEQFWLAAVTTRLNLAELHLSWAAELRRVGRAEDASEHEEAASAHAAEAIEATVRPETWPLRSKAHLLKAIAGAERGDPQTAAETIRRSREEHTDGLGYDASWSLMAEAAAHARAGDLVAATEAARRSCAALPPDAPAAVAAAALHTRAGLVAAATGNWDGMAYGDHLALTLDAQRQRNLEFARSLSVLGRLRAERDRMQRHAYTDALTGLANRHAFLRFAQEIARRPDEQLTVAVVDVDDLKLINDRHGHRAGDELLRMLAVLLSRHAPREGIAARLGGDEFVLVARRPPAAYGDWGGHIARDVAAHLGDSGAVSIGVSVGRAADLTALLLGEADRRMYDAKHATRAVGAR